MSKNTLPGSEKSSIGPTSSLSVKEYLDSFRQSVLRPSTLPPLKKYLALCELDGERETAEGKADRRRGLFESLIGDPRVLFYDLLDEPDSYESGTAELLQELINGKKIDELTPEQIALLDRAVLVHASTKIPRKSKPKTPDSALRMVSGEDEEESGPTFVMPTGPTFWWRR